MPAFLHARSASVIRTIRSLRDFFEAWRKAVRSLLASVRPRAPEGAASTVVAKTTQHPLGDLVSVPLQYNFSTASAPGTLARAGRVVWGVGPVFSLPTATNAAVRTGEWRLGPGAVVLVRPDPFVLGALVSRTVGFQPTRIGIGHVNNVIRRSGTGRRRVRLVTSVPFPKKKKTGSN